MTGKQQLLSARSQGLLLCHHCHRLQKSPGGSRPQCKRCGSALHSRAIDSVSRTRAPCISASIFVVFANVYPIMLVTQFGKTTPDTIMTGIIALAHAGMLPIAIIVFVASIAVPFLKLIALFVLLLVIRFRLTVSYSQCALLFRVVRFIGRWSMLDLFVIAIMVALVNMGSVTSVDVGPAATFFATVVLLTMLLDFGLIF